MNVEFLAYLRMEFTFDQLRYNSFCLIADILFESGKIVVSTLGDGTHILCFSPRFGERVTLCPRGDLCDDVTCRMHHLHYIFDQSNENFPLCLDNENCVNPNCPYRHTNRCNTLISSWNQWRFTSYQTYHDYVKYLASFLDRMENEHERMLYEMEQADMIDEKIITAHQLGDYETLAELEKQGYDINIPWWLD